MTLKQGKLKLKPILYNRKAIRQTH